MRVFLIVLCISLLGSGCSSSGSKSAGTDTAEEVSIPEENLKLVNLEVKGMTCEGCENTVVSNIRKLDGIQDATASHTRKEAVVRFDSTRTSVEAISKAIADAGYLVEGEKTQDL